MTNEEPKADWLNHSEIVDLCRDRLQGGDPLKKPIRKRGFHRALKRGEIWALIEQGSIDMVNNINKEMFGLK